MGGESGPLIARAFRNSGTSNLNIPPLSSQGGANLPPPQPITYETPNLLLSGMMQGAGPGSYIGGLPAGTILGSRFPATSEWDRFQAEMARPLPAAPVSTPQMAPVAAAVSRPAVQRPSIPPEPEGPGWVWNNQNRQWERRFARAESE